MIIVVQGRIACCNVLSDLYAMGVDQCDNMLMILAVSTAMTDQERDVIIPMMIRGFSVRLHFCLECITNMQHCVPYGCATAVIVIILRFSPTAVFFINSHK